MTACEKVLVALTIVTGTEVLELFFHKFLPMLVTWLFGS